MSQPNAFHVLKPMGGRVAFAGLSLGCKACDVVVWVLPARARADTEDPAVQKRAAARRSPAPPNLAISPRITNKNVQIDAMPGIYRVQQPPGRFVLAVFLGPKTAVAD